MYLARLSWENLRTEASCSSLKSSWPITAIPTSTLSFPISKPKATQSATKSLVFTTLSISCGDTLNPKVLMISSFQDGLQKTLNGFKINPEHDADDYVEYQQTGYWK